MPDPIIVGCDLHDRSMLLQTACGKTEPEQRTFLNDSECRLKMVSYLHNLARKHQTDRIVFVYEASGQGFGLYDLLRDHSIECYVLSPTHLPQTVKSKKNKTDAKDALKLLESARGYVLAGNDLPIVWTPPERLRDDRELIRARLEAGEALTQVKLKILSLLKRRQLALPESFARNRNWSKAWLRWLEVKSESMPETVATVLRNLLKRIETLNREILDLERSIRELSRAKRYKDAFQTITQLKGVGMLTAMTFLTEIGDASRFSNRRQIASYLGVVPSSKESGNADDRKGHITRQGPSRVRKVLCQAAWAAVRLDEDVRRRWLRIKGKKKNRGKKAVVAIMRQLAVKMWHQMFQFGTDPQLCGDTMKPVRLPASAQALQKGPPLSLSPSLQPQPVGAG